MAFHFRLDCGGGGGGEGEAGPQGKQVDDGCGGGGEDPAGGKLAVAQDSLRYVIAVLCVVVVRSVDCFESRRMCNWGRYIMPSNTTM